MLAVGSYNFCHASVAMWRPSVKEHRYPQVTANLLWIALEKSHTLHETLAYVAMPDTQMC